MNGEKAVPWFRLFIKTKLYQVLLFVINVIHYDIDNEFRTQKKLKNTKFILNKTSNKIHVNIHSDKHKISWSQSDV